MELTSSGESFLKPMSESAVAKARWKLGRVLAIGTLKTIYLLITITVFASSHPQLGAQEVTTQATPSVSLPDEPGVGRYPEAKVVPEEDGTTLLRIESNGPQSKIGNKYIVDDDVVLTYGDRTVRADHIEYDTATGELTARGHLKATGGTNNEIITASHGAINLKTQTGRFYDVEGSVGLKSSGRRVVYASDNPFLFTGRMVVKTGPQAYEVHDGTVTSCRLPNPHWMLYAGKFAVDGERATARNSVFRVVNVPLLYLPYVTHPVGGGNRQSGFLIPVLGQSSTKGSVVGEQIYWAIGRSMDLTVGAEYFSRRGWAQSGTFRYRGSGLDFARVHYNGLLDRGYYTGGQYVNQGGEDVVVSARHDFSDEMRVVADVEYLSSYPYRQAFTENFNQAVSSDVLSHAYGVLEVNGLATWLRADRYVGLKRAGTSTTAEQQVRIFHAPSVELGMTEHPLGKGGLRWSVDTSATGLKRVQPNFATTGLTERFDLHPQIAYPVSLDGWKLRPSIAVRETIYSRSQQTRSVPGPPIEDSSAVNRADFEAQMDMRAPVVERTFHSKMLEKMFGSDVKHTIEPAFTYRYVTGVNNFLNVLRFDEVDVVSNTNELEYGVTQRLYLRPVKNGRPCAAMDEGSGEIAGAETDLPADSTGCGRREWISWRVGQKYFFDPKFGGAVVSGRRNIFETTLSYSGIAFLTEPRDISPMISRLRVHPSEKVDVEWDFDLDTGAKKFTSNNVLVDVREGNFFSGLSYARLNAPGRFFTQGISSSVSDFSQLRFLLGYGGPTKKGLGAAANVGLDLNLTSVQYGALQISYNWDCCGLSVEYRKYELGSVRNENAYRFNFTLANIGTAGNLRRAERLF